MKPLYQWTCSGAIQKGKSICESLLLPGWYQVLLGDAAKPLSGLS
ncbi:hypothetical protein [Okeania sp. SIO1I7]|nr:hypothetical protein [Okeania sp. SIO1I7]